MSRAGAPRAEIAIDAALVHRLIRAQHPDLAARLPRPAGGGWDNEIYRLGEDLAIRLPRRAAAAPLLAKEQRWLAYLAPRLPIAIPVPVRIGEPTADFPWSWSVVPWFTGRSPDVSASARLPPALLGDFMRSLHQPAPSDAPRNPVRGCALADRARAVEARLARVKEDSQLPWDALLRVWQDACTAPVDLAPTWLHGDLHPRNLLVSDAGWRAVLDWGDLGVGDPATDLAALWMLWSAGEQHDEALAAYGSVSSATLRRARGWAVSFATLMLEAGRAGDAAFAALGAATCERLAAI